MNKYLITPWNGQTLGALCLNGKIAQLNVDSAEHVSILNNIYIGKVKNIVKNINSAFVEIGGQQIGYLNLTENPSPIFAGQKKLNRKNLVIGDEIIVQVERDAVKTKAPVLTTKISFAGRYTVLTAGKSGIGISTKIHDENWKIEAREIASVFATEEYGIIIRTNSVEASKEQIEDELKKLISEYQHVVEMASYRTCFSMLYQADDLFTGIIKDIPVNHIDEIVTDSAEIYEKISESIEHIQPGFRDKVVLYHDELLPLAKLYKIDTAVSEALSKKVWLKSGGYLIIEQTEAMVVIDVNTGKYSGKKNIQETIFKINMEAAKEIAFQLRLRNLSGIILVDFIDMNEDTLKKQLLKALECYVSNDIVKTSVVDMTGLNLVELTRKKVKRPFYEQLNDTSFYKKVL